MRDTFSYQINNQSITLIKPTVHTLRISRNIRNKIHINKIELARYILYYSQLNYKEDKHVDYTLFKDLTLEKLKNIFCEYINSDEELLKSSSIKSVSEIEEGVRVIINKKKNFETKFGTVFLLGNIFLEADEIWINAIHGNFSQLQAKSIMKKWMDFKNNILPKLQIDSDTELLAKKVTQFLNENANALLIYSEKISLLIEGLEIAKLWIPSRLISEVSKQFIDIELNQMGLRYLPKLILKLIDKEYFENTKTDILNNEWFINRTKIINEIFDNLDKDNYHSVISLGLTQIDYLVFKIVSYFRNTLPIGHTNSKIIEILLDNLEIIKGDTAVDKFKPSNSNFEEGLRIIQFISLTNYLNNYLFKDYNFYKDKISAQDLNRHAILHGKISSYGTYENALRIIMLIDDLLFIFKHYIKSNNNLV